MDIYKEAIRTKLRVQTSRGPLSAEQLNDLPPAELDALAVSLQEKHESRAKTFRAKRTAEDKVLKLQFDIVLDILTTKDEEAEKAKAKAAIKAKNQKIREVIAEKQEGSLKTMSIKKLEELLEEEEA
jgi:hypothetical protein